MATYALTVVLETDLPAADTAALTAAIRQLRGVLDVQPVVADVELWASERRAAQRLENRLLAVIRETQPRQAVTG